ncbi:transposase [Nocardia sp. BMG111209]|uniref:transposase n=1 Tax=Nocardia sp. BMG111209 TaxID=1160137 RepID=UPI00037CC6F2|nr:transposase [Nocardia sp. BMG111209]
MAGRKRHSPEEIVSKLRRAEELAAAGATRDRIAAELEVSVATLSNWRRQYAGAEREANRELERLREQNARLKRLLIEAVLEKDALRCAVKARR